MLLTLWKKLSLLYSGAQGCGFFFTVPSTDQKPWKCFEEGMKKENFFQLVQHFSTSSGCNQEHCTELKYFFERALKKRKKSAGEMNRGSDPSLI